MYELGIFVSVKASIGAPRVVVFCGLLTNSIGIIVICLWCSIAGTTSKCLWPYKTRKLDRLPYFKTTECYILVTCMFLLTCMPLGGGGGWSNTCNTIPVELCLYFFCIVRVSLLFVHSYTLRYNNEVYTKGV